MFVVVNVCFIFVCFYPVRAAQGVISISAEHTGSYEINNANSNDLKLLYNQERDLKRQIYSHWKIEINSIQFWGFT